MTESKRLRRYCCPTCGAKQWQPCRNYLGVAKQPCPARGTVLRSAPRPLRQTELQEFITNTVKAVDAVGQKMDDRDAQGPD